MFSHKSFKTKGNLTKHLRSKAHYKRCVEMGVVPVPTVVDESHVNEAALAWQVCAAHTTVFSVGVTHHCGFCNFEEIFDEITGVTNIFYV